MKFTLWFLAYVLALLAEVSILPPLFGAVSVSLHTAVLVLGIAFQGAVPGFWFALLGGLLRDALAPAGAASHALFALGVFLVMRGFLTFRRWDEPLRKIGAVLTGLVAVPAVWFATARFGRAFGNLPAFVLHPADLISRTFLTETIFTAIWFGIFAFGMVRIFRSRRTREVGRL